MADRPMEPEDPRLVAAARHALHDEEMVAAFAVDGDAAEDAERARALIERCQTCRDLHADLVAVGSAIRAAGTAEAVGAVRAAPQDFRLTASDAVRLRGGNIFQRAAARFGDGVATFGRPVGATFAALGVVGLLVGTMALAPLGSPTSMTGGPTGAHAPGATFEGAAGYQSGATAGPDRNTDPGPRSTSEEDVTTKLATEDDGALSTPVPWVFAGSLVLLILGAAFLRSGAARRRSAPRRANRT